MDRSRHWQVGATVGSVVLALTLIACSAGSPKSTSGGAISPVAVSPSPSPVETPSATPSPTAAATSTATSTKTAKPSPTHTVAAKPGKCPPEPSTVGTSLSARTILSELKKAHGVNEYSHVEVTDSRLNGKQPVVHIPLTVLKAVAAQESGWTSNCVSSDGLGGYGTMQLDASTADTSNLKLGTAYDRMNAYQNVLLGNEWLEYLTVHFGIEYFHNNFNLLSSHTIKGVTQGGGKISVSLRDAVFAAYNTGLAQVDQHGGTTPIYIGPKGLAYVRSVNGLMQPGAACQRLWGR